MLQSNLPCIKHERISVLSSSVGQSPFGRMNVEKCARKPLPCAKYTQQRCCLFDEEEIREEFQIRRGYLANSRSL